MVWWDRVKESQVEPDQSMLSGVASRRAKVK